MHPAQILSLTALAIALPAREDNADQDIDIPEVWEAPQKKFWRRCLEDAGAVMNFPPKFVWLCEHHPHPQHLTTCPRFWELPKPALKIARKLIVDHCNSKTGGKWE